MRTTLVPMILLAAATSFLGCSSGAEEPYKATPMWSGAKADLPAPPQLPTNPIRIGDSYTVFGAIHQWKNRIHSAEVTSKDITIEGYIVKSNIPDAPACAQHKQKKKDPEDCKNVPLPAFWIADQKGDTKGQMIEVLGWARNFAVVYDAMDKYKNLKDPPKELEKDDQWSVDVPFPLPAVGAKVKVTGSYGISFTKATDGIVSDPNVGVMTYKSMVVTEPAPAPAEFTKLAKK